MRNIVRTYIEKQQLLSGDGPVLVGLSGGADSVALLALLVQLDYPCVALHCNFHLRGDESVRDEQFAREMARTLDVPFYKIDLILRLMESNIIFLSRWRPANCVITGLKR